MTAATERSCLPENAPCNILMTNQLERTVHVPTITPRTPGEASSSVRDGAGKGSWRLHHPAGPQSGTCWFSCSLLMHVSLGMRHAPIRLDNAVHHCTIDHVAPILTDDGLAHDDALAHDHQGFAIGTRGYRAFPLPSLAVHVMVWVWGCAIAKVEARHTSAQAPPTVLLTVRNSICFSLCAGSFRGVAPVLTMCRMEQLAEKRHLSSLCSVPLVRGLLATLMWGRARSVPATRLPGRRERLGGPWHGGGVQAIDFSRLHERIVPHKYAGGAARAVGS